VQHPGQLQVGGVPGLSTSAQGPGHTWRGTADDLARPRRPLVERVLFDDEPDLLVPALDLFLRPDQPRHDRIASSIFG
jgi:hypothetical protein